MILLSVFTVIAQPNYCDLPDSGCLQWGLGANGDSPCWQEQHNFLSGINDIYFVNDDVGFVLLSSRLFKTNNGGLTFNEVSYPNISQNSSSSISFISESVGYLATRTFTTFYIFKTTNSGASWELQYNSNNIGGAVLNLELVKEGQLYVTMGDDNVFFTRDNFNSSWTYDFPTGFTRPLGTIFKNELEGIYIEEGRVFKTSDGGDSWSKIDIDFNNYDFDFYNGEYYLIGGNYIARTNNPTSDLNTWDFTNAQTTFPWGPDYGGFGVISEDEYWYSNTYSQDFGCSVGRYETNIDAIVRTSNFLYGYDNGKVFKYTCMNDKPHDNIFSALKFDLPSTNSLKKIEANNLQSAGGLSGFGIPLPSCWVNDSDVARPFYFYFKGNGNTYNFLLANSNMSSQLGVFSGTIDCLNVVNCDENNQFENDGITFSLDTNPNEDYYILIDHSGFNSFELNISTGEISTNTIDVEEDLNISIYPNPSYGNYTIQNSLNCGVIKSCEIYDIKGRFIKKINSDFSNINLSDLPNNTFVFKINTSMNSYIKQVFKY